MKGLKIFSVVFLLSILAASSAVVWADWSAFPPNEGFWWQDSATTLSEVSRTPVGFSTYAARLGNYDAAQADLYTTAPEVDLQVFYFSVVLHWDGGYSEFLIQDQPGIVSSTLLKTPNGIQASYVTTACSVHVIDSAGTLSAWSNEHVINFP